MRLRNGTFLTVSLFGLCGLISLSWYTAFSNSKGKSLCLRVRSLSVRNASCVETKCFSCILSCVQMRHWNAGAADHWTAAQCNAAAAGLVCVCAPSVFNCSSNYQRGLLMFTEIQRQHYIVHYVPFTVKFRSISTQITIFCWDAVFFWGLMLFLHLHFLNKEPKPDAISTCLFLSSKCFERSHRFLGCLKAPERFWACL